MSCLYCDHNNPLSLARRGWLMLINQDCDWLMPTPNGRHSQTNGMGNSIGIQFCDDKDFDVDANRCELMAALLRQPLAVIIQRIRGARCLMGTSKNCHRSLGARQYS